MKYGEWKYILLLYTFIYMRKITKIISRLAEAENDIKEGRVYKGDIKKLLKKF